MGSAVTPSPLVGEGRGGGIAGHSQIKGYSSNGYNGATPSLALPHKWGRDRHRVVSQFEIRGSTRARVTRRPCHAQRKAGAPIWNSPPVSRQVIGRTRLRVRLADARVRGTIQLARLVEWAQPTTGGQRPTGLDPKRPVDTARLARSGRSTSSSSVG